MTSYDTNPDDAELGPSPLSQEDERNDAINRLQEAGMEPMETAPKDREIVVVLDDAKLTRERVYWQDDFFGGGCWMDADAGGADDIIGLNWDGAPDSPPWPHWDAEELLGWLPEGTT